MRVDYEQLQFIDLNLRKMLKEIEDTFGIQTITSLYRINDQGSKVHETLPLRAVDLRCFFDPMGQMIRDFVNSRWIYDTERPEMKACLYHDTGGGIHLHFQVHPNTVRR